MRSWNDRQVELLRPNYPDWDIWVVTVLYGPDTWCARPKGHPIATVNADSPEHLIEDIARQSRASLAETEREA